MGIRLYKKIKIRKFRIGISLNLDSQFGFYDLNIVKEPIIFNFFSGFKFLFLKEEQLFFIIGLRCVIDILYI
jgi:hypothetical protein